MAVGKNKNLIGQYSSTNLIEKIISALKGKGVDLDNLKPADLVAFEEFHIGGRKTTRKLSSLTEIKSTMKVLDIGCGIGGPARTLALEFGCDVTGIDISDDYIEAAIFLSEKLGLSDKTDFVCGEVREIPFEDNSFDIIWSQHLIMNIKEKELLLSEIKRVLKPGGVYLFHEAFSKRGREIIYPVFWADNDDVSFLVEQAEYLGMIEKAGFKIDIVNDVSKESEIFFEKVIAYNSSKGVNPLSLNLLVQNDFEMKIENMYENLLKGNMEVVMGKVISLE